MGRNTEIYMFNREKASDALYQDLQNKIFHKRTFQDYLKDRKKEFGSSYDTNYLNVLKVVKDDVNKITADDLFEILLFISEDIHRKYSGYENQRRLVEGEVNSLYDSYGIILLYELPTSTVCSSYMFQYGIYTDYFPIDEVASEDGGVNIDSIDFLRFNDYMILLMKKIMDSQILDSGYEFSAEEMNCVRLIRSNDDLLLNKIIDDEFIDLESYWKDEQYGTPESNTIWRASEFFSKSVEMKKIIKYSNTRIVIVDSY